MTDVNPALERSKSFLTMWGIGRPEAWELAVKIILYLCVLLGFSDGSCGCFGWKTADLMNPTTFPLRCDTSGLCGCRKSMGVPASMWGDSLRCSAGGVWTKPTWGGVSSFTDLPRLLCLVWFAQGHPTNLTNGKAFQSSNAFFGAHQMETQCFWEDMAGQCRSQQGSIIRIVRHPNELVCDARQKSTCSSDTNGIFRVGEL